MRRALWVELTVAANPRDKKACDIRRELQILYLQESMETSPEFQMARSAVCTSAH